MGFRLKRIDMEYPAQQIYYVAEHAEVALALEPESYAAPKTRAVQVPDADEVGRSLQACRRVTIIQKAIDIRANALVEVRTL